MNLTPADRALADGIAKAAAPSADLNIEHLRGAISAARTPAPWELEAMAKAIKVVMHDEHFQAALQRYAHANGSSQAIAQAAVAAIAKATGATS